MQILIIAIAVAGYAVQWGVAALAVFADTRVKTEWRESLRPEQLMR